MSLNKNLPNFAVNAFSAIQKNLKFDMPSNTLSSWNADIKAASDKSDNTITIYDVIGENFWSGGGVTDNRISAALRSIGEQDVVVNINSPGGDMFEGIAIYNTLREHPAKVTVNVMGLAGSAASIIAMAGDEINMGDAAFFMIHNAWTNCTGNRHDMTNAATQLEAFDEAMANLYVKRTGLDKAEVVQMMDNETFINSAKAIEIGFADGTTDEQIEVQANGKLTVLATIESALIQAGHPPGKRKEILSEYMNQDQSVTDTDDEITKAALDKLNALFSK